MRHLPSVVVAEVQRRRDRLLTTATGRVLDLDEPGALALVLAAGRADQLGDHPHDQSQNQPRNQPGDDPGDDPGDTYDTIVSTCRLIDVADLPAAVAGLHRLLAPGGAIRLVEPVNRPGISGLLWSSAGTLLPGVVGLHLGRDVVRTMRADGLAVVDLDRFVVPTVVWPLRRFVELRAIVVERSAPAPALDPETEPDPVSEGASS